MRRRAQRSKFRRDYKRQKLRGKVIGKLDRVVVLLVRDGMLDRTYQPHKLSGEYEGLWECHIEPDWLLIFNVTDDAVILFRTGTHADLFE